MNEVLGYQFSDSGHYISYVEYNDDSGIYTYNECDISDLPEYKLDLDTGVYTEVHENYKLGNYVKVNDKYIEITSKYNK